MSALGQKQTFGLAPAMSALPPKADILGAALDVRYVPKADIGRIAPPCVDFAPCARFFIRPRKDPNLLVGSGARLGG